MNQLTLEELNLLLKLNGNLRLEHLEQEIFNNRKMSYVYIRSIYTELSVQMPLFTAQETASLTRMLYAITFTTQTRWPSAELLIIADRTVAIWYAIYVMKERWLDLEKTFSIVDLGSCLLTQNYMRAFNIYSVDLVR